MAEKKTGMGWFVALGWLVLIGSCVALWPEPKPLTPEEQAAKEAVTKLQAAMIRCENETESRIADPEGFDVAPYAEWRGLPDQEGEGYTFEFNAKAKNGFGALVWGTFLCHVTYDGKYWSVKDITQQ
jgi:hypothetical protein